MSPPSPTDSSSAYANINSTQRYVLDQLKQNSTSIAGLATIVNVQSANMESIIGILKALAEAQLKAAVAHERSEVAQAETQGKLDALIQMWDDWIRDRNKSDTNNGKTPPPPNA